MHLAAAFDLVLAHDGDVVLRLAGHDTRAAPGAGGQVDRHAPRVVGAVEVPLVPEREAMDDV